MLHPFRANVASLVRMEKTLDTITSVYESLRTFESRDASSVRGFVAPPRRNRKREIGALGMT